MTGYEYRADQELPAMQCEWLDNTGAIIDFTTGWTFTVKVAKATAKTTIILTKTAGITQATATAPVSIDWTAADMTTIATALATIPDAGTDCVVYLYARRNSDSKDRVFRPGNPPTFRLFGAPA